MMWKKGVLFTVLKLGILRGEGVVLYGVNLFNDKLINIGSSYRERKIRGWGMGKMGEGTGYYITLWGRSKLEEEWAKEEKYISSQRIRGGGV